MNKAEIRKKLFICCEKCLIPQIIMSKPAANIRHPGSTIRQNTSPVFTTFSNSFCDASNHNERKPRLTTRKIRPNIVLLKRAIILTEKGKVKCSSWAKLIISRKRGSLLFSSRHTGDCRKRKTQNQKTYPHVRPSDANHAMHE